MSRRDDIRRMASLVGNSAAHVAIYRGGAEKEVGVYMGLASDVAEKRTWNQREAEEFREMAVRRAGSVMRERIKRGDLLGYVGKTGKALGPHLHYEVRINNSSVNPYNYILEE